MKLHILAQAAIIAMLLMATLAHSAPAIEQGVQIRINLLNQDPDPAQPGDTVELRFKIENNGSTNLNDVDVEILQQYPFTIIDGPVRHLGTLPAGQVTTDSNILKYRVLVAPNAATQDYPVDIRYKVGDAWIIKEDYLVSVKSKEADLQVDGISITPPLIEPGDVADILVTLSNPNSQRVRDVKVKLDLSDASLPFAPYGSSNEIPIPDFPGGAIRSVNFKVISEPSATANLYKIPLVVTYADLQDNKFNKTTITGVQIGSAPEIIALVEKSDILAQSGAGTLTVKLVNKGLTDLHFVVLSASTPSGIDIISGKQVYLGKIESDDFETADFKILVKDKSIKSVNLPLSIEFRDAANKKFTQNITVSSRVLSDAEAQQLGLTKGGNILLPIVLVVLAIGGVWWFFLRPKKKR